MPIYSHTVRTRTASTTGSSCWFSQQVFFLLEKTCAELNWKQKVAQGARRTTWTIFLNNSTMLRSLSISPPRLDLLVPRSGPHRCSGLHKHDKVFLYDSLFVSTLTLAFFFLAFLSPGSTSESPNHPESFQKS